ncbi:MAG: hypothetical protein COA69_09350 [Robiginitomaculum sp.]|nr:MAG: hypothetical protein COA69_09350 [Robiginitomaculum sp.]
MDHVIIAELTTILLIVVAVGSLLASQLLMKKQSKQSNDFEFDNTISTYATRNAPLPYCIGVRRFGARVISVWGRHVVEESTGAVSGGGKGGGGGGGGGDMKQEVYYENAVHYICLGPANRLRAIYQNGEEIWTGTAAIGGDFQFAHDLGKEGAFKFRAGRGTVNRPYHRDANGTPLFSNEAKYIVSIEWTKKKLGGSPDWPQMEYLIESLCPDQALEGSAYLIKPPGGDDEADKGVNAAHALHQLLTAPWPHGAGLTVDQVDGQSLKELGYLCEQEGLAVNLAIEGDVCSDVVADILNILGVMMSEYQGKLYFRALRPENAAYGTLSQGLIVFTEDMMAPPRPEITINTGILSPTRIILNFPDRHRNFRANQPISMDNDGAASRGYIQKSQNTSIITSRLVGNVVASRKLNEFYGDTQGFKLPVTHGAHLVLPGDQVDLPEIGQVRVLSVEPGLVSDQMVSMEFLRDSFGVISTGDGSDIPPDIAGVGVEADAYVDWLEVPADEANGEVLIVVFRLRSHIQIVGASIHAQADGGDYINLGQQGIPCSGGPMWDAIGVLDGPDIIEFGPFMTPLTEDSARIVDLRGDLDSWRAGRQLCKINDEVFFLRNIEIQPEDLVTRSTAYVLGDKVLPPSGSVTGLRYECVQAGTTGVNAPDFWPDFAWQPPAEDGTVLWQARPYAVQLQGLIRARFGTSARTHPIGSIVTIIEKTDLRPKSSFSFAPDVDLCVKTQPYTANAAIDLSLVSPVCHTLEASGLGDLLVDESGDYYHFTPTDEFIGLSDG